MNPKTDRNYLLNNQYRNASNLNARIQLHQRFSVNRYGWLRWVFDRFELPEKCLILELGCGSGVLWSENRARIPSGWEIVLSDFSPGMLADAHQNLGTVNHRFRFGRVDAQVIPFVDGTFDAVIANHMLYHVPDRERAFSEVCRVLKPGGRFYAATNGRNHLRELATLSRGFDCQAYEAGIKSDAGITSSRFSLENGQAELAQWFANVTLCRYEDALVITEVEPLMDWAASWAKPIFGDKFSEFCAFLKVEFNQSEAIRVTKESGLFQAVKP